MQKTQFIASRLTGEPQAVARVDMMNTLTFLIPALVVGAAAYLYSRRRRESNAFVETPATLSGPTSDQGLSKEEATECVSSYIRTSVRAAFVSPDEILQTAREIAEDEGLGSETDMPIEQLIAEELAIKQDSERSWPVVTDCDKLDNAFMALERAGVVARQNFACCQNCGHAEIGEEIETAESVREIHGYTFYHSQDTDSAVEGSGLYLAYGSTSGDERDTLEVAREICEALRDSGLEPEWNGTVGRRIAVPIRWQRRAHA